MKTPSHMSLLLAANAAGFATVWHDDERVVPRMGFVGFFSRFARLFG